MFFHLFSTPEPQEDDFEVYEPYCANYTSAVELMLAEEQNLQVRLMCCTLCRHDNHERCLPPIGFC